MSNENQNQQIIAKKLSAPRKEMLDPGAVVWSRLNSLLVETAATPLANQPSPYIKATFDEKVIGAVKELQVKAAHNGQDIFFRLEWGSETPNYTIGDVGTFPDGVSLLLPFKSADQTPIKEMGSKDFPTNSWYWRPDFEEKPKNQIAHGLSTSLYTEESSLVSGSKWEGKTWRVVIARPLSVKEEAVNLAPGSETVIGFAVWEGGNGERGGVKAFSKEWRKLILE
ncbi:MAG: ethylbenzene dehydrogenase-related protein [Thermodesulfobacteriota bacterium]